MAIKNLGLQIRHDTSPQLRLETGILAPERVAEIQLQSAGDLDFRIVAGNDFKFLADRTVVQLESSNTTGPRDVTLKGLGRLVGGLQAVFRIEGVNGTPIRVRVGTADQFSFEGTGLGVLLAATTPQIYWNANKATGIQFENTVVRVRADADHEYLVVRHNEVEVKSNLFQASAVQTVRLKAAASTFEVQPAGVFKWSADGTNFVDGLVGNDAGGVPQLSFSSGGSVSLVIGKLNVQIPGTAQFIQSDGGTGKAKVGFFGAAPAEQAGKTDLDYDEMVTALKNYGLFTPATTPGKSGSGFSDPIPIGTIMSFPRTAIPAGWLRCEGQQVPAGSIYDELRALMGTGQPIPDLRGQFLRGATDAQALLTKYDWTTGQPKTPFSTDVQGDHQHTVAQQQKNVGWSGTSPFHVMADNTIDPEGSDIGPVTSSQNGNHVHSITGGGDTETAPEHVVVEWCIKAAYSEVLPPVFANYISNPVDQDVLVYNGTSGFWGNSPSTSFGLQAIEMTQTDYDNLPTPDPFTLYLITGP